MKLEELESLIQQREESERVEIRPGIYQYNPTFAAVWAVLGLHPPDPGDIYPYQNCMYCCEISDYPTWWPCPTVQEIIAAYTCITPINGDSV